MSKTGIMIRLQLQALFKRKKRKNNSLGITVLIVIGIIIAICSIGAMAFGSFYMMSDLCSVGFTWLYFSIAGIAALCVSVFGSTMMSENVLYGAKDNDLLLSMPIKPGQILFGRMFILFLINVVLSTVILVISGVVYGMKIGFGLTSLIGFIISLIGIPLVAQVLVCLLGWLLHLLLSKVNNAIASIVFLSAFFVVYYAALGKSTDFLLNIATNGEAIGTAVKTFGFPIYVMGMACEGHLVYSLIFVVMAVALTAVIWFILSKTFLKVITMTKYEKKRKMKAQDIKVRGIQSAVSAKEFQHFFTSPVYLTNMGLGMVLMVLATGFGLIAKGSVDGQLAMMGLDGGGKAMAIFAIIGFLTSMCVVSSPTISLEGKNLWILKSMPVSTEKILMGKLRFAMMCTVPFSAICTLALALRYEIGTTETLILTAVMVLLAVFCQTSGLIINLKYHSFDWLSETVPCKQGLSVILTMLVMWAVIIVPLGIFLIVMHLENFCILYGIYAIVLAAFSVASFAVIRGWGSRAWDNL